MSIFKNKLTAIAAGVALNPFAPMLFAQQRVPENPVTCGPFGTVVTVHDGRETRKYNFDGPNFEETSTNGRDTVHTQGTINGNRVAFSGASFDGRPAAINKSLDYRKAFVLEAAQMAAGAQCAAKAQPQQQTQAPPQQNYAVTVSPGANGSALVHAENLLGAGSKSDFVFQPGGSYTETTTLANGTTLHTEGVVRKDDGTFLPVVLKITDGNPAHDIDVNKPLTNDAQRNSVTGARAAATIAVNAARNSPSNPWAPRVQTAPQAAPAQTAPQTAPAQPTPAPVPGAKVVWAPNGYPTVAFEATKEIVSFAPGLIVETNGNTGVITQYVFGISLPTVSPRSYTLGRVDVGNRAGANNIEFWNGGNVVHRLGRISDAKADKYDLPPEMQRRLQPSLRTVMEAMDAANADPNKKAGWNSTIYTVVFKEKDPTKASPLGSLVFIQAPPLDMPNLPKQGTQPQILDPKLTKQ